MKAEFAVHEKELIDGVVAAIHNFSDMQKQHGALINSGKLDDVPKMCDQRARAFGLLRQTLNSIWRYEMVQKDMILGEEIQQGLELILEQEKKLADRTASLSHDIKGRIANLRRGRKAVAGYGLGRSMMPKCLNGAL